MWTPVQVDVIFAVYDRGEDDLAYKDFLYGLQKREGNMIYAKELLEINSDTDTGQSVFSRIKSSFMPQ